MIDFSKCIPGNRIYGGERGEKKSIIYNGSYYMLKFSPQIKNYQLFDEAEHLGCGIFNLFGIKAQETLLGIYTDKNTKRVVACKDFVDLKHKLIDFASIKNEIIDSKRNNYFTEFQDILFTINKLEIQNITQYFWKMFIIDALLGNKDRNSRNWGFLEYNGKLEIAPIFDCGSSFFPHLDDSDMKDLLKSDNAFNEYIYSNQEAHIKNSGERIEFLRFIQLNKENLEPYLLELNTACSLCKLGDYIESSIGDKLHVDFFYKYISKKYNIIFESR